MGEWVYFWDFYLVPLLYISSVFLFVCLFGFFCQYHIVLMTVALYYNLKSGRLIPPAPFFFLRTALAIWCLLCFHMNCDFFLFQFCEKRHW